MRVLGGERIHSIHQALFLTAQVLTLTATQLGVLQSTVAELLTKLQTQPVRVQMPTAIQQDAHRQTVVGLSIRPQIQLVQVLILIVIQLDVLHLIAVELSIKQHLVLVLDQQLLVLEPDVYLQIVVGQYQNQATLPVLALLYPVATPLTLVTQAVVEQLALHQQCMAVEHLLMILLVLLQVEQIVPATTAVLLELTLLTVVLTHSFTAVHIHHILNTHEHRIQTLQLSHVRLLLTLLLIHVGLLLTLLLIHAGLLLT
jgi:hypothetical protein